MKTIIWRSPHRREKHKTNKHRCISRTTKQVDKKIQHKRKKNSITKQTDFNQNEGPGKKKVEFKYEGEYEKKKNRQQ